MGYFDRKPTPKQAPLSTIRVSTAPAPRPATKFIKHTALFLGVVTLTTLLLSPRSRVLEWQRVLGLVYIVIVGYTLRYVLSRWWRDTNERVLDTSTSALILGVGLIGGLALAGPFWGGWVVLISLLSIASLLGLISLFFPKLLLWFRDRLHLVFILLYAIVIVFNVGLFFGIGLSRGGGSNSWFGHHIGAEAMFLTWLLIDLVVLAVSFLSQKLWRLEKLHLTVAVFCALTIGPTLTLAIFH